MHTDGVYDEVVVVCVVAVFVSVLIGGVVSVMSSLERLVCR